MNYKEMSDVDIAAAILEHAGYKMIDDGDRYAIYNSKSGRKDIGEKASAKFKFDPCNNPSDAWPIMKANGIAAVAEGGVLVGATNNSQEFYEPYGSIVYQCLHTNPLRAAMIVFLMMQEQKK